MTIDDKVAIRLGGHGGGTFRIGDRTMDSVQDVLSAMECLTDQRRRLFNSLSEKWPAPPGSYWHMDEFTGAATVRRIPSYELEDVTDGQKGRVTEGLG